MTTDRPRITLEDRRLSVTQPWRAMTASGELLWLEFHRYVGDGAHRPPAESLAVFPFGEPRG